MGLHTRMSMEDWARLGGAVGDAYATYGENQIRSKQTQGQQEVQQFTPEQLAEYQRNYERTGQVGEMTPQGLRYGSTPDSARFVDQSGGDVTPGATYTQPSFDTTTGQYTEPGMRQGLRPVAVPGNQGTLVEPQTRYTLGDQVQDKRFTPEQEAAANDAELVKYWQSAGQYGRDRLKEREASQAAGLQRDAAKLQIQNAEYEVGMKKIQADFAAAMKQGDEGVLNFYNSTIPDGQHAIKVPGKDGSFSIYIVPEGETDPSKGRLWKNFTGDSRFGLTPSAEFDAEVQTFVNQPENLRKIWELRARAYESAQHAAATRAAAGGSSKGTEMLLNGAGQQVSYNKNDGGLFKVVTEEVNGKTVTRHVPIPFGSKESEGLHVAGTEHVPTDTPIRAAMAKALVDLMDERPDDSDPAKMAAWEKKRDNILSVGELVGRGSAPAATPAPAAGTGGWSARIKQ